MDTGDKIIKYDKKQIGAIAFDVQVNAKFSYLFALLFSIFKNV